MGLDGWEIALIAAGVFLFVLLHFPCFWFIFRKLFPRKKEIQLNTIVVNNINIIQPNQVVLGEVLGKGHFGEVKKGKWDATDIAVKRVIPGTQMDQEARILSEINHPNIVRVFGVFPQMDFMIMEYCNLGSLREFLHIGGFTAAEKRKMCLDVCKGMQYVSQRGIVHRDLAARNVLVVGTRERFDLKISDFGMSREGDSYYSDDRTIPYRWSAPEVFTHLKFSQASDVWSYGVVCWEIYEEGKVPYHGLTNGQVHDEVLKGKRLECPSSCDAEMWRIIFDCFKEDPKERQNFKQIATLLDPDNYAEVPKESPLKKHGSRSSKKKQNKTPRGESEPIVQEVEIKKEPAENDYEMKGDDYERSKDQSESSSEESESSSSEDDKKNLQKEGSLSADEYNTSPKPQRIATVSGNDSRRSSVDHYNTSRRGSEDHYNTDKAPAKLDSRRSSDDHYNTSRRASDDHYNTDKAPIKKESSSEDHYNTSPKSQKKNNKQSSSSSDEDSSSSDSEDEYNTGPQLPKAK